jgi:hypothetical protein
MKYIWTYINKYIYKHMYQPTLDFLNRTIVMCIHALIDYKSSLIYTCIHTFVYIYMIYTYMFMYVYTYDIYIYIYVCIYIYRYINTFIGPLLRVFMP